MNDAELMFQALGFTSADDMVSKGYGLEPEEINVALSWLRLNPPKEAIPFDVAYKNWESRGRDKTAPRNELGRYLSKVDNINTGPRTKGGTSKFYILARLDRDGHAELAAKVRAGEKSANAAAIEFNVVKAADHLPGVRAQIHKIGMNL